MQETEECRMAIPLALQLYSLRKAAAKDFPAVLKDVAAMGYRGVETAGLQGMSAADVKKILDDLGMEVAACHAAMPTKDNISSLVDDAQALATTRIVSGRGADSFKTEQAARETAALCEEAATLAAENGLQLGYHNHWWEFQHDFNGSTPYDIFMAEAPSISCEIDVYWVADGGADPVALVEKLKSRTPLLHIKDGPLEENRLHTAVGVGVLDIPAIIGAADPGVTEWLIVELDNCATDMAEAVRESARYLIDGGLAEGR